jgi:tritrans,polycis-undecaprenyl-diphosphate synthase [geranylgeranyl-diphosphate specific]
MADTNESELKMPGHLGIIMDGNRRFAKKLMQQPWQGHKWGAQKVRDVLQWCSEFGIKKVTLYAFSVENFDRPKIEFDYLMKLFEEEIGEILHDESIHKNKIKVRFIGRTSMFPKKLQENMKAVEEATKKYSGYEVNFAMAYGGRTELVDAAKKIGKLIKEKKIEPEDIDEKLIEQNLYDKDNVDFVIRTSGEKRTSGFMLWQSSYAELYFCDKCWPEMTKDDFAAALTEYSNRNRRFGK